MLLRSLDNEVGLVLQEGDNSYMVTSLIKEEGSVREILLPVNSLTRFSVNASQCFFDSEGIVSPFSFSIFFIGGWKQLKPPTTQNIREQRSHKQILSICAKLTRT